MYFQMILQPFFLSSATTICTFDSNKCWRTLYHYSICLQYLVLFVLLLSVYLNVDGSLSTSTINCWALFNKLFQNSEAWYNVDGLMNMSIVMLKQHQIFYIIILSIYISLKLQTCSLDNAMIYVNNTSCYTLASLSTWWNT